MQSIGVIKTPHITISNMPIQPLAGQEVKGEIWLNEKYIPGLKDIEGFSHLTLIYHFHKIDGYALVVTPFMDTEEHGIFACRSPKRPNAIGISTVELLGVENGILHIKGVDMLNDSPLLDIKPFFQKFDNRKNVRSGWLEKNTTPCASELVSDDRFKS